MSVKWDEKTDYQALINEAVAKKDYKAAAQYEQQRNAKIKHLDATGTNQWNATATNNYAGWLDNTDYSLVGKEQMASGANWEDVLDTYNARYNKAANTEGLKQYANDDVQKEMWDYIVTGMKASQKPSTPAYTVQDNSAYIEQMNKAQREAAIAEIKAAYEKNKAAIDRAGSGVSVGYQNARNEAAGASELAKRNNAQYAAAYGLNTGTGGQMELARNVALQNNLNSINTAEGQSMADLALQRANAETEYNNAIAQANAQGNSELASQLYQEKVRVQETLLNLQIQQAQMEYQAYRDSVADSQWQQSFNQNVGQQNWQNAFNSQQYADQLAQQDWQNYFNATQYLNNLGQQSYNNLFNQTQYNDSQTAQKQSDLANAGWSFLKVGALPSSEMLAAMGMTAADAQAYIAAAKAASKTTTNNSTASNMTLATAKDLANNGIVTEQSLKVLNDGGYNNDSIKSIYGIDVDSLAATAANGYDNGSLSSDQVKMLQSMYGLEQDGFWGPNSQKVSGMSADEAWAKYVGSNSRLGWAWKVLKNNNGNAEALYSAMVNRGDMTTSEIDEVLAALGL